MDFVGGLILGLGIGVIFGVLMMAALSMAKQSDPDYESDANDPDNTRMDRQDGRYAGPAARPTPGL
jgi:hypothetical protein